MLPTEIKYLLDNYEAEDITLIITKADYFNEIPVLNFTLHESAAQAQYWTLKVIGHRASSISFTTDIYDTKILLTNDHPLLWQYSDIQSELYFNGSSKEIHKLISDLNQIDFKLFSKYQNSSNQLYTLLKTSNGSLGRGSKKLLTKYATCLNSYGIKTSIVSDFIPSYFNGKSNVTAETLNIFIIGDSYIVGQDFLFAKID